MKPASWPRPTRRGVVVVVSGIAVTIVGELLAASALVFAGASMIALVLAAHLALAFTAPALFAARRFAPERPATGDSVLSLLSIAAPSARTGLWLSIRERCDGRLLPMRAAVAATLRPGVEAQLGIALPDLARGRHRIGPAQATVLDPFALASRRLAAVGVDEIVVQPEVVPLGRVRAAGASGDGSRSRLDRRPSGGQDDPITREYRRGDPMRRVHWKATARQGDLMVRQDELHSIPRTRIVLPTRVDDWPDARPTPGAARLASAGFEWAVSAVASLAVALGRAGSETQVITVEGVTIALHRPETSVSFLDELALVNVGDEFGGRAETTEHYEPVIALVSASPSAATSAAIDRGRRWRVIEVQTGVEIRDLLDREGLLDG